MPKISGRVCGVELYFNDLAAAKRFYEETLGLKLSGEQPGHHAQFDAGAIFLCLEKKGVEGYPSQDKAVIFLEVDSVQRAVDAIGAKKIVHWNKTEQPWAVMHDPEGHNILLLEKHESSNR
jgi:predicted enzyme related to lactoylglutathione lyase